MRIGKDTGSLTNYLLSGTKGQPTPEVGMGVTVLMWSDRYAGTITRVSKSGKTFWFKRDKSVRVDGRGPFTESQQYRFEPDPMATEREVRLNVKGEWKIVHGGRVRLGDRNEYRDPCF